MSESVSSSARDAGRRALESTRGLDRAKAYERICLAVRKVSRVVPELIESPDGSRRLFWPENAPAPDPELFDDLG